MATQRLLQRSGMNYTDYVPATSSAGASSAGLPIALNAQGLVDQSMVGGLVVLTYAATVAVNWSKGAAQKITLTGNVTFTFASPVAGTHYLLELTQDSTGSRTVTWPTIRWQGGTAPTLTTTAAKTDLIVLIYDGTSYFGQAALNF